MALNMPGLLGDSFIKFPWRASCAQISSGDKLKEYIALEGAGNCILPGHEKESSLLGVSEK